MTSRAMDHFNWGILLVTLGLLVVGIVAVYSATWSPELAGPSSVFKRHLIYVGLGLTVMTLTAAIDYRVYERFAYILYAVNCLLLFGLLAAGRVVAGSVRWIDLGIGNLQPSETAKLVLVVALAKFFHDDGRVGGYRIRDLGPALLLVAIPGFLIYRQPDLGSTLFQLAIFGIIVLFAKVRRRALLSVLAIVLLVAPLAYNYGLNPYQKDRIKTFMQPERDPRGKGYQTIQARYAIGAGRLTGTGFLAGTQTHQGFIPEQHTDFIFTVLGEEWGLAGGALVLGLYAALILLGLIVAAQAKERFGVFIAIGASSILFLQVMINLGGVLGLLPLTGVTLPMLSYGGSSMLTVMVCVGLLLNVSMRRYMF